MAVLSDDITLRLKPGGRSLSPLELSRAIPVYATADSFYAGALVEHVSGLASPLGVTTGGRFAGVCTKGKVAAANSLHRIPVALGQLVEGVNGTEGVAVAGVTGASDKGRSVFCSTDNIRDATLTWSEGARLIGEVYRYRASGYADILTYLDAEIDSKLVWIDFGACTLSGIGSYAETRVPGFRGRLLAIGANVVTASTDDTAAGVLTPTVNATAVTGALTLGDHNTAPLIATVGVTHYQAISGAGAVFEAGQEVLIAGTQTTAYDDGVVRVIALVERNTF